MLSILICLFHFAAQVTSTTYCYIPSTTSTAYQKLSYYYVETQRACEVKCSATTSCTRFALSDAGNSSKCVLLGGELTSFTCASPVTLYTKTSSGCPTRTNLTAELGVDPCVDGIFPSVFLGSRPVCPLDASKTYVIRAVGADGLRYTLDNDSNNNITFNSTINMWQYAYKYTTYLFSLDVVAAVCATAGATKCPCSALPLFPSTTIAVKTEQLNPCPSSTKKMWNITRIKTGGVLAAASSAPSTTSAANSKIMCQAGAWMVWLPSNSWQIQNAGCY